MWRKIVAGLALFAVLINVADAAGRVRAPQKLLLLENVAGSVAPPTPSCSGGSSAIVGSNTIWTFQSSGTFTCNTSFPAQLLVVAGGGGAGGNGGGGGGGGGVCSTQAANCGLGASITVPLGATTVTVGAGGTAGNAGGTTCGGNGANSSFGAIATATGGGGSGCNASQLNGSAGGSGGGGGAGGSPSNGGAASPAGQGNAGGSNASLGSPFPTGGGGGAGGVGVNASGTTIAGNGGPGISNSITGTAQFYGPGGGGGVFTRGAGNTPGVGGTGNGLGGHGDGLTTVVGTAGTPNTGGGGGGGSSGGVGFIGGSGVVILSCLTIACGNGTATFTGVVATRNYIPYIATASTTGWNSRTAHYARVAITSLQVCDVNWYVAAGSAAETNNTGTSLITRTIEYPAATYTRVTWSAATSVTLSAGQTLCSDPVAVSIPQGAVFFDKKYQVNSTQVLRMNTNIPKMNLSLGDVANNSNVDETATTSTDSGSGIMIPPAAIVGTTSKPSICGIGDSRMIGQGDTVPDATGDSGYARMFGGSFAYINMGTPGILARDIVTGGAKRFALAKTYCTHMFLSVGGNDLNNSITAVPLEQSLTWLSAQWPSLSHVIIDTQAPWTTSSDGWTTTAGQTVMSWEAQRVLVNTFTSGLAGYNQIVNVGGFDGNGTNGQFWNNPVVGGSQFTADGVHENSPSLVTMAAGAIFTPSLVTYP